MTLPVLRTPSPLGRLDPLRWSPLREFDDLQDRMSRLMASVFGPLEGGTALGWAPLADVTETEDAYLVEVDLPGIKREDISVEVVGSELLVTGESTHGEREGQARSRARRVGRFEYRTLLPSDVDADNISAELAEGVLIVRVPKSEAAKPRRIEITGS